MNSISPVLTILKRLITRPPMRGIVVWSTMLYLLLYLWALGDLRFHGWRPGFDITWVAEPLSMIFKERTAFYYEGIAIIKLPLLTYLFSPVNLIFALILGILVGLNLAISYASLKRRQGHGAAAPLFASILALMAGTACSAPLILVLLGIQATAGLLGLFSVLVPLALVLLIITLVINLIRMRPEDINRVSSHSV